MKNKPVRWSEGMLMLPHHFQAADAWHAEAASTASFWLQPHGYGIHRIEINSDALDGFELRISSLDARLKDGTIVSVPRNAQLAALDLKQIMADQAEVFVHLVLPELQPGLANTTMADEGKSSRFVLDATEWDEVNDGDNAQGVDVLRYNAKLVATPTQDSPENCDSIVLMKLKRSLEADSPPKIDAEYFPPLLNCHSWSDLREGVLASIHARLGSYIQMQADYLKVHGGWSEGNQPQIRKAIRQLEAANTSYPELVQITESAGSHPRVAYLSLCRLVGQLAVLRDDWMAPALPLYDHDKLGEIFHAVKAEIDAALAEDGASSKVSRYPFENRGEWYEVQLDPQWLQPQFEFFIGVRSDLPAERLEQLFSSRWLDWKLGSSRTINRVYTNAEAGLNLRRVVGVHDTLPVLNDLTYFAVKKVGTHWDDVSESRTLALKVNDRYIVDAKKDGNALTVVDPKNAPRDLRLELFILNND